MSSSLDFLISKAQVAVSRSMYVALPGEEPSPGWDMTCSIGGDVEIVTDHLEAYCFHEVEPIDVDLLTVTGAVAYADRRVRRHPSVAWARRLRLSVPVYEMGKWSARGVVDALEDFLNYTTGDFWTIEFRRRRNPDKDEALQLHLLRGVAAPPESVLAYSAGLDSFAQLQLMSEAGTGTFLITAEHDPSSRERVARTTQGARSSVHSSYIPIRFHGLGHHAEVTYRTRTLLFLAAASVAARLARAHEVVIAENGQGSIGPMLVTFGREHPYRATYPGLTLRYRAFLERLWETSPPPIRHPRLWQTKGEVLGLLKSKGLAEGWRETRSCSRGMKRIKRKDAPDDCGLCGNCLLRRFSVAIAGLEPEDDRYYFRDLGAPSFETGVCGKGERPTPNDEDIGRMAVLDLEYLARQSVNDPTGACIDVCYDCSVATYITAEVAEAHLARLLEQHQHEWNSFLGTLPAQSWIRRTARGD
jgi:hypothetical protein